MISASSKRDTPRRRLRAALVTTTVATTVTCAAIAASATGADAAARTAQRTGTHAEVPWTHVGSGWTVALWARKRDHRATVFLVSPGGHRYAVTRTARSAYLEAWSRDGRTALLRRGARTIKLDLRTGRRAALSLPHGTVLALSRDARAVYEAVDVPHGPYLRSRLERFGVGGRHQVTYRGASGDGPVIPLAGARLVASAARSGVMLYRHDGSVIRRLGPKLDHCSVSSLWRKGVVLARCNRGALWAIPLSGAPVRKLTDSVSKENPWGYDKAWRYSSGRLGLAENGCGPDTLVRFDAKGHGNRISVPSPIGRSGTPAYVGHHGNVVTMLFTRGCMGMDNALFAYDAVTHTSTALLGPTVNGGGVLDALPWATND